MYAVREIPGRPVIASVPNHLPIDILLALPAYVTMNPQARPFNLPGAIQDLLGEAGWDRATKVLNPRVWAPGWNSFQLAEFVSERWRPGYPDWPLSPSTIDHMRAGAFPGTEPLEGKQAAYGIVHFAGSFRGELDNPLLNLGTYEFPPFDSGRLRDALVKAQTRLAILFVAFWDEEKAIRLAEQVVGRGGPAVLVVCVRSWPWVWEWELQRVGGLPLGRPWDRGISDAYFKKLYANLVRNQSLPEAARPDAELEDRGLNVHLFHGIEGADLLRFDRWLDSLNLHVRGIEEATSRQEERLQTTLDRVQKYLHASKSKLLSQMAAVELETLRDIRKTAQSAWEFLPGEIAAQRPTAAEGLETPPMAPLLRLTTFADMVGQLDATVGQRADQVILLEEKLEKYLRDEAREAPRVLNAGFADPVVDRVLTPREALVAGQEYDLLVDVGPRWNRLASLVTGNAGFPEQALNPEKDSHLVQVVLVSDDFAPAQVNAAILVPRSQGRSYPVTPDGQQAEKPGPVALRLRAPEVSEQAPGTVHTARGRLCLYYENNLLQSAQIRVGVTSAGATPRPDLPGEDIARRAQQRWLERGRPSGDDSLRDWFEAERELQARAGAKLQEPNVVRVDFALTETFQELHQYARRSLQFDAKGEAARSLPVAVNLTLNDDGSSGHRLLVKGNKDLPPLRVPYDAKLMKEKLDKARELLQYIFYERGSDGSVMPNVDAFFEAHNAKSAADFRWDLTYLARFGRDLFSIIAFQMKPDGKAIEPALANATGAQLNEMLRTALAEPAVIQANRTGNQEFVFPWALVYDIPLDLNLPRDGFPLCDGAAEKLPLKNGTPRAASGHRCKYHSGQSERDILCPSGFWGVRHVIEQPPGEPADNAAKPEDMRAPRRSVSKRRYPWSWLLASPRTRQSTSAWLLTTSHGFRSPRWLRLTHQRRPWTPPPFDPCCIHRALSISCVTASLTSPKTSRTWGLGRKTRH
jgi:hypothetical protein